MVTGMSNTSLEPREEQESDVDKICDLLPPQFAKRVKAIPDSVIDLTDNELVKLFNKQTDVFKMRQLRQSFWLELTRAERAGQKVSIDAIVSGIYTKATFSRIIANDKYRLCYILRPPKDYEMTMEAMLDLALEREYEVLSLPMYVTKRDKDGNEWEEPNSSLIGAITRIRESLQNRLYGSPTQKTINYSKTENTNKTVIENPNQLPESDIKRLIEEAQAERGLTRDVTPSEWSK